MYMPLTTRNFVRVTDRLRALYALALYFTLAFEKLTEMLAVKTKNDIFK